MTVLARKICLLGDFAVGKTSTVARFVNQTFSEAYQTTVGVKVDSKAVSLDEERTVRMVVWDIAGSSNIDQTRANYVKGAHGLMLVADGTRQDTFTSALDLWLQACDTCGGELPAVLMVNKADLADRWEVSVEMAEQIGRLVPLFKVSARTGASVEDAFSALAGMVS
ncbi:Rab family GTPase [Luteibacter sp. Lutesp34]|uniref:Rab family GTPase n=1 Tax=Luteibacter sp. Lutesp34 TaxID=3243030 RepID=UPI0039B67429